MFQMDEKRLSWRFTKYVTVPEECYRTLYANQVGPGVWEWVWCVGTAQTSVKSDFYILIILAKYIQ